MGVVREIQKRRHCSDRRGTRGRDNMCTPRRKSKIKSALYECRRQSSQKHTSLVCLRETKSAYYSAECMRTAAFTVLHNSSNIAFIDGQCLSDHYAFRSTIVQ
jgi:hypothetical protein